MACDIALAPSFPLLKSELLRHLAESSAGASPGPRWLVVPTSILATHLQVWLGRNLPSPVFFNLRICGIEAIKPLLLRAASLPGVERWPPLFDLLLFETVKRLPEGSVLSHLQDIPAGFALLKPTFLDLAEGGFGPGQVDILEEIGRDPALQAVERDVLTLYRLWIDLLEQAHVDWQPLLMQQLAPWIDAAEQAALQRALQAEAGQKVELFVYGFYDFTDVNLEILSALGRRLKTTFFLPCGPGLKDAHPAFSFVTSILEDLKSRLGTFSLSEIDSPAPKSGSPLQFFLKSFPEGPVPDRPPHLSHQRASGVRAEVISAALRIRRWLDREEAPLAPEEILLVAPDIAPYQDAVREIFAAFAIPVAILDQADDLTPDHQRLRALECIWRENAPVERILAYFRDHPSLLERRGIVLEEFEPELRRLPFWGGPGWKTVLDFPPGARRGDFQSNPCFSAAERSLLQEIVTLWTGPPGRKFTPAQAREFLLQIGSGWMEEATVLEPLLEALQVLHQVQPDMEIPGTLLRSFLSGAAEPCSHSDPATGRRVLFVPLMQSRGLTASGLIFLGLCSGKLPFRIDEDPLLSDPARRRLIRLARDVGHRLSVKTRSGQEMILLFFLLNTAAGEVHWVIPETDSEGRAVAPTPWVQRYLQAWQDAGPDFARIPRGPTDQARFLLAQDDSGALLPPRFGMLLQPELSRVGETDPHLQFLFERGSRRAEDPHFCGLIPEARFAGARSRERVTVTGLEDLCRCPYRFYGSSVAGLETLQIRRFVPEVPALEWGSMVHGALEESLRPWLSRGCTLQTIAAALLDRDGAALERVIDGLGAPHSLLLALLPPPLRQATRQRLFQTLRATFQSHLEGADEAAVPEALELKIRVAFPGERPFLISGQIDRVDRLPEGTRVIDYKSGRDPWKANGKSARRDFRLGFRMQPYLYPWLFQIHSEAEEAPDFCYLYLGEDPPSQRPVGRAGDLVKFLEPLGRLLEQGHYFVTSRQGFEQRGHAQVNPCAFCELTSLCRRLEGANGIHALKFFESMAASRYQAMEKVLAPEADHE